jgi:5-methyltetrahydropteroyltriglutamate--homocysteine methyltransferase
VYVKDRLTGFDGESAPLPGIDADEFPEWTEMARQLAPPFQRRPTCTGPIEWQDWPAVERDIQTLREATAGGGEEVFMTSPSPGQIGRFLPNRHYPSDEAYLYRLADVMAREYRAIVPAGFTLQVDCPDLALGRHTQFAHLTLAEFRRVAEMHVEVLNVVGRERVIAGCDCGFGTFAGRVQVDTNIVWHKLASLVEGARLASAALW